MRVHSDTLTQANLDAHVPSGCYLEIEAKGSRKRAHAFDVHMSAEPGSDQHGIKRAGHSKAATYIEWGDWMVELLKLDQAAIDHAERWLDELTPYIDGGIS